MTPDDKVCYCFHVSLRKLVNFARREQPRNASQLTECLQAGTGCGWCIPVLQRIHAEMATQHPPDAEDALSDLPDSAEAYEKARSKYIKSDEKRTF